MIDGAVHRAWITAMGRQSSVGHLAHFVCEMFVRLQLIWQADDQSFHLPFTQMELGDILGLSSVHISRTIQDLRARSLLQWQDRVVTILNWDKLRQIAEFDPRYLSLQRERR